MQLDPELAHVLYAGLDIRLPDDQRLRACCFFFDGQEH